MARLNINVGTNANDGTGDDLRTAMQKINTNFIEVYGTTAEANDLVEDLSPQLGGDLDVNGYIITSASNGNISIVPNGTGLLTLGALKVNGTTVSADDSTKITLAESVDITGVLQVNEINSADSSAIQINDGVNVSGTLTANIFVTNAISSSESSAIQINDSVNISGTLTVAGGITGVTILTRAAISDGVASTATSAQTSIDTTAAATYRSVQYYLSVSDPTNLNYALYNILITHDGTLAYISSNLVSSTGVDLGDFNADISGGNVRLLVTPATSDTVNYTFVKTAIVV